MLFHLILRRLVRSGTLLVRYPDGPNSGMAMVEPPPPPSR